MWNEIIGALAIVAMVYLCANVSEVIAAVCDRIRYGVQPADVTPDAALDGEAPATTTAPAGRPAAARKPVATKVAA